MISPHELKNKAFTRVMRGYSPEEVDEHIAFLLAEYTDLYKANDELTRRIALLEGQLETYSKDSEAIRTALLSAQKVSARIVDEANAKAEVIVKSVKEACDAKLEEIKGEIARECSILNELRAVRSAYQSELSAALSAASDTLDTLPVMEEKLESADDALKDILQGVKDGIASMQAPDEEEE